MFQSDELFLILFIGGYEKDPHIFDSRKSTIPEISEVIILRKNARIFFVARIINKYTLTVKRDRPYQTESQSFGEANR